MQQTFLKKFCRNTCNETAIITNFHFSHYKVMENLGYHSNQSTKVTAIKINFIVEANAMNITAKLQLHRTYGFREDDFFYIFLQIYHFGCHGN